MPIELVLKLLDNLNRQRHGILMRGIFFGIIAATLIIEYLVKIHEMHWDFTSFNVWIKVSMIASFIWFVCLDTRDRIRRRKVLADYADAIKQAVDEARSSAEKKDNADLTVPIRT